MLWLRRGFSQYSAMPDVGCCLLAGVLSIQPKRPKSNHEGDSRDGRSPSVPKGRVKQLLPGVRLMREPESEVE